MPLKNCQLNTNNPQKVTAILELVLTSLVSVPDDLPYPDDREMILLLATVIVQARPIHLLSTLNYADLFAWTVPKDMM